MSLPKTRKASHRVGHRRCKAKFQRRFRPEPSPATGGEDTKRNLKHAKRLLRLCLPSCGVAETDLDLLLMKVDFPHTRLHGRENSSSLIGTTRHNRCVCQLRITVMKGNHLEEQS